jgi:hypothetical protein
MSASFSTRQGATRWGNHALAQPLVVGAGKVASCNRHLQEEKYDYPQYRRRWLR